MIYRLAGFQEMCGRLLGIWDLWLIHISSIYFKEEEKHLYIFLHIGQVIRSL